MNYYTIVFFYFFNYMLQYLPSELQLLSDSSVPTINMLAFDSILQVLERKVEICSLSSQSTDHIITDSNWALRKSLKVKTDCQMYYY